MRDERERKEQLLWVEAYIDHTSVHGPKTLYDEAIAYYKELIARPLTDSGCRLCKKPAIAGPQLTLPR